jgi:Na+-translocating ferredoxin:NAD+ oxidoreductase subunit B
MKRAAVALIDEPRCIGCTRCILACPVDAIAGAEGYMHAVIAKYCTGCELCLPACPVDCIDLVAPPGPWSAEDARAAKHRAVSRKERLKPVAIQPADRRSVIARLLAARKAK